MLVDDLDGQKSALSIFQRFSDPVPTETTRTVIALLVAAVLSVIVCCFVFWLIRRRLRSKRHEEAASSVGAPKSSDFTGQPVPPDVLVAARCSVEIPMQHPDCCGKTGDLQPLPGPKPQEQDPYSDFIQLDIPPAEPHAIAHPSLLDGLAAPSSHFNTAMSGDVVRGKMKEICSPWLDDYDVSAFDSDVEPIPSSRTSRMWVNPLDPQAPIE